MNLPMTGVTSPMQGAATVSAVSARDYASELAVLMAMTKQERQVHFLKEQLESEEYWLDWLVDSIKQEAKMIEQFKSMLSVKAREYQIYREDWLLDEIEGLADMIENTKSIRKQHMNEVKEQRVRVQCSRTKLREITKKQQPS